MTSTALKTAPHPAKWTAAQLAYIEGAVPQGSRILDPFAGTGRIHELRPQRETWGIEMEQEWANYTPDYTLVGDSRELGEYEEVRGRFDWIVTSPCFGNRMADHHEAKDTSRRMTYRHQLGRKLTPGNAAGMQWGEKYWELHREVYAQFQYAFRNAGPKMLLLNMKNHYRGGVEVDVISWHTGVLLNLGFDLRKEDRMPSDGMRFGENHEVRTVDEVMQTYRLK